MIKEILKKLVRYSYYDETGKKIAILDEVQIKTILQVDEVKFKEEYC